MKRYLSFIGTALALAFFTGCATQLPDTTSDHPANPDAAQAAAPAGPRTLESTSKGVAQHPPPTAKPVELAPGSYPLAVCIVSGKRLGSMGEPIIKIYDGREVRLCCPACVAPFEADNAGYFKKLDEAIAKQKSSPTGGHDHGN